MKWFTRGGAKDKDKAAQAPQDVEPGPETPLHELGGLTQKRLLETAPFEGLSRQILNPKKGAKRPALDGSEITQETITKTLTSLSESQVRALAQNLILIAAGPGARDRHKKQIPGPVFAVEALHSLIDCHVVDPGSEQKQARRLIAAGENVGAVHHAVSHEKQRIAQILKQRQSP